MKPKIKMSEVPQLAEIKLRQRGYLDIRVQIASRRPLSLEVHPEVGPVIWKEMPPIDQVVQEISQEFDIVE